MSKDAQLIFWGIILGALLITSGLTRIATAIEKQKPIGQSKEAEHLSSIAHFLWQIRDILDKVK